MSVALTPEQIKWVLETSSDFLDMVGRLRWSDPVKTDEELAEYLVVQARLACVTMTRGVIVNHNWRNSAMAVAQRVVERIDGIEVWTDGSGPPPVKKGELCVGVGGWAAIVKLPDNPFVEKLSGAERATTISCMEMTALLKALERFEDPRAFIIHTDSSMLMNAFTEGWIESWKRNGWINSKRKPVANRDLWEQLNEAACKHISLRFVKVKGHSGLDYNDQVDELANRARTKLQLKVWP